MSRTEAIGCRVHVEIKAAARQAADDDHRSIASLLEKLLVAYLRQHGYLPESHPGGVRRPTATATVTDRGDGEAAWPPLS